MALRPPPEGVVIWAAAISTSLRWHAIPPLWVVVLVVVPAVVFGVRFFYRREAGDVGRKRRATMGALRALAILLVLFVLFGPFAETIEGEHFKRHLILVVDSSASMAIRDAKGYSSNPDLAAKLREAANYPEGKNLSYEKRIEIVRDILGSDRDYLERLAEQFQLHLYAFSGSTAGLFEAREGETPASAAERFTRALQQLDAIGSVTRVGTAIRDLVGAFGAKNEPVAGVLLFTDGRHNGGAPSPIEEARQARVGTREGIKVFPVAVGDPAAAVNISVSRVDAPEVALANDEVTFTVTVHARGLAGDTASISVEPVDERGNVGDPLPGETEPFELPGENDPPKKVVFRRTFREPGRFILRVGVPSRPSEAVDTDNYKRHVLRVVELKMHVLFVASKPNYTYRFLKEALLRAEETIDAQVLLLSAESEWPQEASRGSNPVRMFPQEKRDLARHDVLILMDIDPATLQLAPGPDAKKNLLSMIEGWVKRGGGLILQAGRDNNVPDQYYEAPLNALLPVVPYTSGMRQDAKDEIVDLANKKRFKLTPAGSAHPIMRILRDPGEGAAFWDSNDYTTEYIWYAPVERAKSSATVLAVRREADRFRASDLNHPLVALQNYGHGKVLWLGTDEFWRMRDRVENLYYWRFWSGAIRHLATYRLLSGNKRIKIWVDREDGRYQVGDTIGIEAKYLDENFEPLAPNEADSASMQRTIKLRAPDGKEEEILVHAILTDPPEGIFRSRIAAGSPGTYSLVAEPEGGDEEFAETTFIVEETTLEKANPLIDMRTLKGIAKANESTLLYPHQFHDLLDDEKIVPHAGIVRSGEPRRTDLWDRAWVLWVFVGLLAAEWILRRKNLLL